MNVGGRMGVPENKQIEITQNSYQQQKNNLPQKINNNNLKNKNINNAAANSEQKTELDLPKDTAASAAEQDVDSGQRASDFKQDREKDQAINSQRNEKDKDDSQAEQETAFARRHQTKLIDQVKVHKVSSGETLWDIAHKHGLNIDSLIGANNISNMNSIKPGQEFKILPVKGIIYRVSPGESVGSISRKFELKPETIMKDNNIEDASSLKIDQKLILRGAKPEFSYQDRLDQKFMYPINTRITSYYGPRWGRIHEGLDFAAPMGSPIRAVSSGRVVYSGWATGYGYVVIVEHQRGLRTLYAHNSKLLVSVGESVGKGEVISRSGNTGNSTGPHLHFEVQVNGRPENPLDYINK
jgi:murein DD-endopeptidase MepM/ murein hydrolase activator NlpD